MTLPFHSGSSCPPVWGNHFTLILWLFLLHSTSLFSHSGTPFHLFSFSFFFTIRISWTSPLNFLYFLSSIFKLFCLLVLLFRNIPKTLPSYPPSEFFISATILYIFKSSFYFLSECFLFTASLRLVRSLILNLGCT